MSVSDSECVGGAGGCSFSRPRVKPEHAAYRTIDGNVRIGSVIYGVGAEIADPQGWVWELVEALDGTRTPTGVVAAVLAGHPELGGDTVGAAMEQLIHAGHVEDADAALPGVLSDRDLERYARSVAFYRWVDTTARASAWEVQARLGAARVLLVGVGGTGGSAGYAVAASGVGHLHMVDGDVVELSNLNRQVLYTEEDIGKPKAQAAVDHLSALNADVRITGEQRQIRDQADLAALLPGYDLLALAADQPGDIRRWANRACLAAGLPWADGGYRGPLVTVGLHAPGAGACWECLHTWEDERADLRLAPGQDPRLAHAHVPGNPVNAISAGLSGYLLAHAALALVSGVPPLEPGCRFGINLLVPGDPVMERHPRRPDCPACGSQP